jgi:hypothetical protein
MQTGPASLVARFAHILATYLPGGRQLGLTHEYACGPHLPASQTVPSHVKISPSGFTCCGGMQARSHAMGVHCSHVVMHVRVSWTGFVNPTIVTQMPLHVLMQ